MKTIIAGSRDFHNIPTAFEYINEYREHYEITEVVCGMAQGMDHLGRLWAIKHHIPYKEFPPDWKKYGNAAGPIRNKQMAEYADQALIICLNQSKGSVNMSEQMIRLHKPYVIVHIDSSFKELCYIKG